jgi:hypothetical protein
MTRPTYVPTCPRECHFDQWRNFPNMRFTPDEAIDVWEDRAIGRSIYPRPPRYLFRTDVSI